MPLACVSPLHDDCVVPPHVATYGERRRTDHHSTRVSPDRTRAVCGSMALGTRRLNELDPECFQQAVERVSAQETELHTLF